MKNNILLFFLFFSGLAYSQDSSKEIFQSISTELKQFTVDTSDVPQDELTEEIRRMREAKGGFNINNAILFKIAEDRNNGKISAEEADKTERFFTTGDGKKWLENAVIRIYRNHFSLEEVKEITKFYQSAAGKKMAESSPIIMAESLKSAEKIIEKYKSKNPK